MQENIFNERGMITLTEQQIASIHNALKNAGFLYVDILHEMTDHIAATLEGMEGDFDRNLELYIGRNKKELKKFNRTYIFAAWRQSWKGLSLNVLSIRFTAFFGIVFLALTGISTVIERDAFVTVMFFTFCAANFMVSYPGVYALLKKRNQYSAGEGLCILNVFVFFPGLFTIKYVQDFSSDTAVVLYFTSLISICAVMAVTLRRFKSNYKLRYNG